MIKHSEEFKQEAVRTALTSHARSNVRHFCYSRRAERLLKAMAVRAEGGSIH